MNKATAGLLATIFALTWVTGGLLPAIVIAVLAVSMSVTTSIHTEKQLNGGKRYRELR